MKTYLLENQHLRIVLSDFGASWLSCQVKLPTEQREVLVTTTPENWGKQSAYFGATVGRYANRIANGRYTLNGKAYQLAQNNGENNLHGGIVGADKCLWEVEFATQQAVRFSKIFANGEEGFGGEVKTSVEYRLEGATLSLSFEAQSDQDTPLCLTNHAYFNLNGAPTIHDHQLQIQADHYLPVAENGIPNAPLTSVENTGFDFRQMKTIRQDLLKDADQRAVKGYDHAFLLTNNFANFAENSPACILATKDLRLELFTTMPAVQLYTGNWLAGQPNLNGGGYADYAGVALEPEFLPDTPNHPEWWEIGGITRAGERYQQQIHYKFVL